MLFAAAAAAGTGVTGGAAGGNAAVGFRGGEEGGAEGSGVTGRLCAEPRWLSLSGWRWPRRGYLESLTQVFHSVLKDAVEMRED